MKPESALLCQHLQTRIRVINAEIPADVSIPKGARGLVVFGDGVGKASRNPVHVALTEVLNEAGLATVLADLIAPDERTFNPRTGELCGGLDLLERRVVAITDWVAMQPNLQTYPLVYFGAGIGAEAALIAASRRPETVRAMVALAPNLRHVEEFLPEIFAPTLFLFGNDDPLAVDRQRMRMSQLPERVRRELILLGHGFDPMDESGINEEVASVANGWFSRHLAA
jgi:putative phosphoribosyl transferase